MVLGEAELFVYSRFIAVCVIQSFYCLCLIVLLIIKKSKLFAFDAVKSELCTT